MSDDRRATRDEEVDALTSWLGDITRLANLEPATPERALWSRVATSLYAAHALDVHQRAAREGLFSALGARTEMNDLISSRRARGATK